MSPTLGTEVATKHAQQLGLDGRVVVFTGAGSRAEGIGNGRATAILLSSCGAKVVLLDACVGGPIGVRALVGAPPFVRDAYFARPTAAKIYGLDFRGDE